jgi:hypothetical protein
MAAGFDVALMQAARRIDALQHRRIRIDHPDIGQAEILGQRIAVAQGFFEMLARIEKHDRHMPVHLSDQVKQHRRVRPEGRNGGDLSGKQAAHRQLDGAESRKLPVARFEGSGIESVHFRQPLLRPRTEPP